MGIYTLDHESRFPKIHNSVFVAPSADIVGDVQISEGCSIWYGAVLRGDVMPIKIGKNSNIQDNCVVHGTYQKAAAILGEHITVGHGAIIHGCKIDDNCLIGMGAIVMDNAHIKKNCIVAAGAVVTSGKVFEEGSLIVGQPARVQKVLTLEEQEGLIQSAFRYQKYLTKWYQNVEEN
ncbi:MAG: gamma carbonic anhydrase family protein [Bdellovibrionales bacterium]|nr:gamma carbonic anhydrase family protein [Bdellovibrionales bacterium]